MDDAMPYRYDIGGVLQKIKERLFVLFVIAGQLQFVYSLISTCIGMIERKFLRHRTSIDHEYLWH